MKCRILHESRGRLRVHILQSRMTFRQADILEIYLRSKQFVTAVKVFDRTCDAVIKYSGKRSEVIDALAGFSYSDEAANALVPEHSSREQGCAPC